MKPWLFNSESAALKPWSSIGSSSFLNPLVGDLMLPGWNYHSCIKHIQFGRHEVQVKPTT